MRIISVNTNGIRAAARKGFFDWMLKQEADVICIQETKAQSHQLDDPVFHPEGYYRYLEDAEKKGYSGCAIYTRHKPTNVINGMGQEDFDREGRYLEVQFGDLSVVSLYLPSGSSSDERQAVKDRFLEYFLPELQAKSADGRRYVVCGDWNIAHHNQDIRNWRGNLKNSGFLPHERAWLTTLFDEVGYVDAFRELEQPDHSYTWWSNRGQAWANNTGWRIDYHILSPNMKGMVKATEIYKEERFSDHAPLTIDYHCEIPIS